MTQKVICVLGMHRSGTSMVTRVLNICGVYIGEENELLSASSDNVKGHWENKEIFDINEEILNRHGGSWDTPPKFPENWENSPMVSDLLERAGIIAEKMSQKSDLWGFKDPRNCLTLPFWKKILPHMVFIILVRDPFEVALSLTARGGITVEKGLFLYQHYWAHILENTDNEKRFFIILKKIFTGWKPEIEKLIHFIDEPEINIRGKEKDIQKFIDPDFYHQRNPEKDNFDVLMHNPVFYFLKQTDLITDKLYYVINQTNREKESLNRRLDETNQENEFIKSSKFWKIRNFYCRMKYESIAWKVWIFLQTNFHRGKQTPLIIKSILSATKRYGGFGKSLREAVHLYRQNGMQGIRQGVRRISARHQGIASHGPNPILLTPINTCAEELLELRILIIAEFSLPQCTKYRVKQKQEMFENLGVKCSVCNWTDIDACFNKIHTHSLIIFYRVPGFDSVIELINEAKRLKIPTFWEVDDIIFNRDLLEKNKSLAVLDKTIFDEILNGASLYLKAMLACDKRIASTLGLAQTMKNDGATEVTVIENALDQQTLDCAEKINTFKTISEDSVVRIVYGSGTDAHNIDFEEASGAILYVLEKYENVIFRLIGPVELSREFEQYESKIEKIPFCDYREYLSLLAECDISIAPLEKSVFNDAKSNIKFLEASIVKIPSLCSPRAAFRQIIKHGKNGFLCETKNDFIDALEMLIFSPDKRKRVGESAFRSVIENYSPDSIATQQILPLIRQFKKRPPKRRVLSVNIFYSPRSFGGATIVAEEINKILHQVEHIEIYVFTTLPPEMAPVYNVRRYETDDGICVFGMGLPAYIDGKSQFENPDVLDAFENVLDVVEPDLVHIHCIQGIGVSVTDLCLARGIEYIVTLHDAWWICERQFTINHKGDYCGQEIIDKKICSHCVDHPDLIFYRQSRLKSVLENTSLLLTPSQFFADFYIKNGFPADKFVVNKNGILKPADAQKYKSDRFLTFGYVGGNSKIKGVHLIKKAFADLSDLNIKLVIVDNTLTLGFSSFPSNFFDPVRSVEIVPAYTQKNMDDFFSKIDVLLFPTQWKESFGLTVREALARNVWVIATDAGGVAEDIIHGENGFIIPFHDKGEALKQAIIDTLNYFKRYKCGEEIKLETEHIRWFEDQADELVDIYKRVLEK